MPLPWKLVAVFLVAVGLVVGFLQGVGVVYVGGLMDWMMVLTFSAMAVLAVIYRIRRRHRRATK